MCLADLMDKILHLSPESVGFNSFAKVSNPNKWNKRHLKKGNGVAPVGQMFCQLINHRIDACLLKGACLHCFLVHLPDKRSVKILHKVHSVYNVMVQ
jgi:hypothetical protein